MCVCVCVCVCDLQITTSALTGPQEQTAGISLLVTPL